MKLSENFNLNLMQPHDYYDISKHNENYIALDSLLHNQNNDIIEIQDQMNNINHKLGKISQMNEHIMDSFDEFKESIGSGIDNNIGSKIETIEQNITGISSRLDAVEQNNTTINGKISTLEQNDVNISSRLDTVEQNLSALSNDQNFVNKINDLENSINTLNTNASNVENNVNNISTKLDKIINAEIVQLTPW